MIRPIYHNELDKKVQDRFWTKVALTANTDKCWLWLAFKNPKGYGQFAVGDRLCMAHRVSYTLAFGEAPTHLVIDHTCRQPSCVNPNHLRLCTNAENIFAPGARTKEALEKVYAKRKAKMVCVNGHYLSEDNTHVRKNGQRECRTCINERARRYRALVK